MMRHLGWCGLILLFGLRTTCAQQPPIVSIVTIAVTDQSGAAVPKAEVVVTYENYVMPAGGVAKLGRKETSQAGEVQFSLAQGGYDVFAHAPGCLEATKHVDVKDFRAERVALTVQMHMDEDCDGMVASEPTLIPTIASEPLTEMIVEIPVPASPALQPRPSPSRNRTKQPLTLNPS